MQVEQECTVEYNLLIKKICVKRQDSFIALTYFSNILTKSCMQFMIV